MYDAPYQQIAAYARIDEAELARGLLESEGIQVALLDDHVGSMSLGPAGGSVRVLVPAWDAGRATAILAEPPPSLDHDDDSVTPVPRPMNRGLVPASPPPVATRIAVAVAVLLAGGLLSLLLP